MPKKTKETKLAHSRDTAREEFQPDSLLPLRPELYINRELSWLEFNRRVLEEMEREETPLLERARFGSIFASNLDEFFMIRVAGVKRKIVARVSEVGPDGRTPHRQLHAIRKLTQELVQQHAAYVTGTLIPELARHNVSIPPFHELKKDERIALRHVFEREIFPVLTPQAIDVGRRFPHISNDSLNLLVELWNRGGSRFARVKIPALLPRLVTVPRTRPEGRAGTVLATSPHPANDEHVRLAWLEEVVADNLWRLFPGSEIVASYPFHLVRDSDVEPDDDDDDQVNLMEVMRETLSQRPFGSVVRVDVDTTMPREVSSWLLEQVHGAAQDLYTVEGPLGLKDLAELGRIDRPDLTDQSFTPAPVPPFTDITPLDPGTIFATLRKRDVLVHHPYQSFNSVVGFIQAAATDPDVIAIKQTLYRIGTDSPLIPALIEARDDDTQITVLVELKARFDEENNITWAQTLEARGVHVSYGFVDLKTHCKLTLVVRREADGLRRYVHIATGNYNANTARLYEDLGLMSSREELAHDVSELFNALTGYGGDQRTYDTLWTAPGEMREQFLAAIADEVASHREHGGGHLIFKMNSLVDRVLIRALYAASQAGVKIDLIVRGICCLRPGVDGWSDNIRVRSIVGRFLEHSRIFYFHNNGTPRVYIGSADLMERNLDRRVEVVTPVEAPELAAQLRSILDGYLRDRCNARELKKDGTYEPLQADPDGAFSVQGWLMNYYQKRA